MYKPKIIDIQNIAIIYICLWILSPYLSYGMISRLFAIFAVVVWMGGELLKRSGIFYRSTWPVIFSIVYVVYISIICLVSPDYNILDYLQLFILILFLVIYESRRNNLHSLLPVYISILVLTPIWMFRTVYEVISGNEYAARLLSHSSELAVELSDQGVGGYGLVYGTVLLVPIVAALIWNFRKIELHKMPSLIKAHPGILMITFVVNVVLGIILVTYAGYSIAIILTVGAVGISLLLNKLNVHHIVRFFVISTLLIVMAQFFSYIILDLLFEKSSTSVYLNKISDAIDTLYSGVSTGAFADRNERYLASLFEFINNPLFGTSDLSNVGGHSTYLDGFARFGILFGSLFLVLLMYVPLRFVRLMRGKRGVPLSVLMIIIFLPLINNISASIGVMLYIFFPVACSLLLNNSVKKDGIPPKN